MNTLSPRENAILSYTHRCPQQFPQMPREIGGFIPPEVQERAPGDGSLEQMFGGTGLDWFGVPWVFQPEAGANMPDHRQPPLLEDICDWREVVRFPDLDAIDWKAAAARDADKLPEGAFRKIIVTVGPFERLHSLMGMEEALCALVTDPDECRAFFEAVVDHKIRLADRLHAAYQLDCIEWHDDWGHQNNSFFSPETFRALLVPPMKRLVDHCREIGVLYEQHCCGYVQNLVPDMVDGIGIGVWSSCQAVNDVPALARQYGGRLVMVGGLDCPGLEELSEAEQFELLSRRVDDVCRGGVVIPHMGGSKAAVRPVLARVLELRRDFYEKPENRLLPS